MPAAPTADGLVGVAPDVAPSHRTLAVGAAAMSVGNVIKLGVQLAMLPVMARLIGPSAYGLYTLAMPTIAFVQLLADGGLGNSLARERLDAKPVWSSAFWAVHAFALLLACGVVGWSFLLGGIAHQPRLPAILSALSLTLPLLAAGVLPGARLMRQGRNHVGAFADIVATVCGAAIAIALALSGAGVWALVGQYVSSFAIRSAVANAAAFQAPSLVFRFGLLRPHLVLGGAIVGMKMIEYLGRTVETAIVSGSLGVRILGIYGFAVQLPRFLCESAVNPIWATLYVIALQKSPAEVARAFYGTTRALAIVLCPLTVLASLSAPTIIHVFFGPAWQAASGPLSIFLLTATFASILPLTNAILLARGRADLQLRITGLVTAGRAAAVATAGWLGLSGAALLLGLVTIAGGIAAIVIPARAIEISPATMLRELRAPYLCAIAAGAAFAAAHRALPPGLLPVIALGLVALGLYAALLFLFEGRRIRSDVLMLRVLVRREKVP